MTPRYLVERLNFQNDRKFVAKVCTLEQVHTLLNILTNNHYSICTLPDGSFSCESGDGVRYEVSYIKD